jgi:hypothetical protein
LQKTGPASSRPSRYEQRCSTPHLPPTPLPAVLIRLHRVDENDARQIAALPS